MAPRKGKGKAKALPKEPEMFTVYGDILQQTEPTEEHEGAILINCGDAKEVWLPISAIQFSGERGDTGVAITIPDWLAEQEGLHDGQGKPALQTAPAGEDETPPQPAAETEAATSQPAARFKAEVTGITDGEYTILVIAGDESREFTFAKDALRFDGDDVVDLQVGYTGIEFLLAWPLAVKSGLADFLGPLALPAMPGEDVSAQSSPEQEAQQAEASPATAEAADDDAPKTKPYKQKMRTETINDYVELTAEEKVEYAQDMSEAMQRRMDHKETAATYSRLSREADQEAYKIKKILDAGREEREIDCDVIGDFNTGETVWVESEWPHREIRRRPMTDKDRQLLLPIDPPAQPQPEPEAVAQPAEPEAPAVEPSCDTCKHGHDGEEQLCMLDTSVGKCDNFSAWEPAEHEEPETVTLYGEVLEQRENETVFRVHYGDDDNTVAEFTIPNEQFQLPAFADTTSTQDFITLTLAYAIEAGIVAAPEEDAAPARTCETCIHYDCTNLSCEDPWDDECSTDKLNPAYLARWEPLAEPEKACNACAHLDFAADNNACEGCGDDLSNFTPLAAAEPQGQPESMEAVQ